MIAKAGVPYGFNYTAFDHDESLFVAAQIYNVTTGTPVFLSQVPMFHVEQGSYNGVFTPADGQVYAIVMLVYTDGTYTTPDPDRSPGAESVQGVDMSGSDTGALTQIVARLEAIARIINVKLEGLDIEVGMPVPDLELSIPQIDLDVAEIVVVSC